MDLLEEDEEMVIAPGIVVGGASDFEGLSAVDCGGWGFGGEVTITSSWTGLRMSSIWARFLIIGGDGGGLSRISDMDKRPVPFVCEFEGDAVTRESTLLRLSLL